MSKFSAVTKEKEGEVKEKEKRKEGHKEKQKEKDKEKKKLKSDEEQEQEQELEQDQEQEQDKDTKKQKKDKHKEKKDPNKRNPINSNQIQITPQRSSFLLKDSLRVKVVAPLCVFFIFIFYFYFLFFFSSFLSPPSVLTVTLKDGDLCPSNGRYCNVAISFTCGTSVVSPTSSRRARAYQFSWKSIHACPSSTPFVTLDSLVADLVSCFPLCSSYVPPTISQPFPPSFSQWNRHDRVKESYCLRQWYR